MIEKIGSISFSNVKHPGINEHPQRVSFAGEADKVELSTTAKEENKSTVNKNWLYALGALALAVGGYFIFRGRNGDDLAKAGQKAADDLNPKPTKPEPHMKTKAPETPKPEPKATENAAADYNKDVCRRLIPTFDGGTKEYLYNKDNRLVKRIERDKNKNIIEQGTYECQRRKYKIDNYSH